jgi:hypothetical protein
MPFQLMQRAKLAFQDAAAPFGPGESVPKTQVRAVLKQVGMDVPSSSIAFRLMLAVMEDDSEGFVTLPSFLKGLHAAESLAQSSRGAALVFPEFCAAVAVASRVAMSRDPMRQHLPPIPPPAVQLRFMLSHIIEPVFFAALSKPMRGPDKLSTIVGHDPALPMLDASLARELNRTLFYYSRLDGEVESPYMDSARFLLFARDVGLFRSLPAADIMRVFVAAAVQRLRVGAALDAPPAEALNPALVRAEMHAKRLLRGNSDTFDDLSEGRAPVVSIAETPSPMAIVGSPRTGGILQRPKRSVPDPEDSPDVDGGLVSLLSFHESLSKAQQRKPSDNRPSALVVRSAAAVAAENQLEVHDGSDPVEMAASVGSLTEGGFRLACVLLLREAFLLGQRSVGQRDARAWIRPVSLRSALTPEGLAKRALLIRLRALFRMYKPAARSGGRLTAGHFHIRLDEEGHKVSAGESAAAKARSNRVTALSALRKAAVPREAWRVARETGAQEDTGWLGKRLAAFGRQAPEQRVARPHVLARDTRTTARRGSIVGAGVDIRTDGAKSLVWDKPDQTVAEAAVVSPAVPGRWRDNAKSKARGSLLVRADSHSASSPDAWSARPEGERRGEDNKALIQVPRRPSRPRAPKPPGGPPRQSAARRADEAIARVRAKLEADAAPQVPPEPQAVEAPAEVAAPPDAPAPAAPPPEKRGRQLHSSGGRRGSGANLRQLLVGAVAQSVPGRAELALTDVALDVCAAAALSAHRPALPDTGNASGARGLGAPVSVVLHNTPSPAQPLSERERLYAPLLLIPDARDRYRDAEARRRDAMAVQVAEQEEQEAAEEEARLLAEPDSEGDSDAERATPREATPQPVPTPSPPPVAPATSPAPSSVTSPRSTQTDEAASVIGFEPMFIPPLPIHVQEPVALPIQERIVRAKPKTSAELHQSVLESLAAVSKDPERLLDVLTRRPGRGGVPVRRLARMQERSVLRKSGKAIVAPGSQTRMQSIHERDHGPGFGKGTVSALGGLRRGPEHLRDWAMTSRAGAGQTKQLTSIMRALVDTQEKLTKRNMELEAKQAAADAVWG